MEEKELFNFGDKELNVNSLLNNITANQQSYLDYYSGSIKDSNSFLEKVNYIKEGIKNGSITTDGTGVYRDTNGKLSKDDKLMNNALHFVNVIATEQSKKTRTLTQSEINTKEEEKRAKKAEVERQRAEQEAIQRNTKPTFTPPEGWNIATAFAHSFNQNGQIPYDLLKQLVTVDDSGNPVYTDLHTQLDKNFDSVSKQLEQFSGTESYINNINLFKDALKDGDLSSQDRFLGMELGFQNSEMDKLNALLKYKIKQKSSIEDTGENTVKDVMKENPTSQQTNVDLDSLIKDFEEDQVGWDVLGPIALDIYSIASPEPWSATGAGLVSDIIGIGQDIRNKGKFHWGRHASNVGFTLLGAIPYIGDAGNVTKVGTKIVEASESINKMLAKASNIIENIPKGVKAGVGTTTGIAATSWAYLDLTSEDSAILSTSQKALEDIKNGEITAENVVAVGNGLMIALQLRKGFKNFRNLDPEYRGKNTVKPTDSPKTTVGYRDTLTQQIKTKNPKISNKDLNAIQGALDKLSNQGVFARARSRFGKPSEEYLSAQKLLREKGRFSESEISEILNQVLKHEKGGVIKASTGMKTPWRLNFDGTTHKMEDIYNLFTENATSYDSKQLADALNKLNSDDYKSLNFEGKDNTLGFKNWNVTFDESGLNNLFGYDENKADYLGVTTRSRNNFVTYLKDKGSINTGNGDLLWNSESNKWEYSNWVDKAPEKKAEVSNDTSTEATLKAPESTDLTLKDLNVKKPMDLNPDGIINSIAGYVTNAVANAKKRKIQQSIPIYQEVTPPEKAFKTAYTYDLEKAKGEIMAEATNLKPITSDASVYYAAKNDAIKNARAYTTKLDTEINDRVHQIASDNQDIAFENAVSRTTNTNTNAKYRHEWDVEQKQGEVDYMEANNQSFQNLNKEIKHNIVTNARKKQKIRDTYMNKHMLTGLTTTPSNYINGWTKHHDLIWYKGQNGLLTTDQEQVEYQQLQSIVNQASMNLLASYDGIKYPDMDTLYVGDSLKETYDPAKHGTTISAAKGAKIDKQKIHKFVNKLK